MPNFELHPVDPSYRVTFIMKAFDRVVPALLVYLYVCNAIPLAQMAYITPKLADPYPDKPRLTFRDDGRDGQGGGGGCLIVRF